MALKVELAWLKFSDTRTNTLHYTSSLVTKNCWEAVFVHPLKQMVQVSVAEPRCHNLCTKHTERRPDFKTRFAGITALVFDNEVSQNVNFICIV